MKITCDTAVVLTALTSVNGAARAIISNVIAGEIKIAISPPLWQEYLNLTKRPATSQLAKVETEQLSSFFGMMKPVCEMVTLSPGWLPMIKDAGSDLVLATAVMAQVDMVITMSPQIYADAAQDLALPIYTPATAWEFWQRKDDA